MWRWCTTSVIYLLSYFKTVYIFHLSLFIWFLMHCCCEAWKQQYFHFLEVKTLLHPTVWILLNAKRSLYHVAFSIFQVELPFHILYPVLLICRAVRATTSLKSSLWLANKQQQGLYYLGLPAWTLPFLYKLFSIKAFKQVENLAAVLTELQQLSLDLQMFCNCLFSYLANICLLCQYSQCLNIQRWSTHSYRQNKHRISTELNECN